MLASAAALVAIVALRTSALQLRVACSAGPVRAFSRQRHIVASRPDSDEADGTWVEGMPEDMASEVREQRARGGVELARAAARLRLGAPRARAQIVGQAPPGISVWAQLLGIGPFTFLLAFLIALVTGLNQACARASRELGAPSATRAINTKTRARARAGARAWMGGASRQLGGGPRDAFAADAGSRRRPGRSAARHHRDVPRLGAAARFQQGGIPAARRLAAGLVLPGVPKRRLPGARRAIGRAPGANERQPRQVGRAH